MSRRKRGLCADCSSQAQPARSRCLPCAVRNRERTKARDARLKAEGKRWTR